MIKTLMYCARDIVVAGVLVTLVAIGMVELMETYNAYVQAYYANVK